MSELRGVFPATVTPYDSDGAFDAAAMRKIVRHQLGAGVHGFYVCGGTGEGLLLTTAEHRAVAEAVVNEVAGEVPVISHVGAFQTAETLARAEDARAIGVDAIAALPPAYFYKPDEEGLVQYYSVLAAAASPLPLLIYNIPQRTGVTMTPDLYARLLEIDNVVGMKDSSGNVFAIGQFASQRPEAVLFSGDDSALVGALLAGASGGIGLTYNLIPQWFVRLWDAVQAADLPAAAAAQNRINECVAAVTSVEVIAAAKQSLAWMGLECGQPRTPIRPLDEGEQQRLRAALDGVGFFDGE